MGTFNVGCLVKNHIDRSKSVQIPKLLVDTGSEATWILAPLLREAAVVPEKRLACQMANGQWLYRDVGYAIIRVGNWETIDEVVFAEPGDYSLLGAHTVEGLNLTVDSRGKKLIPGPVKLAEVAPPGPGGNRLVTVASEVQGIPGPAPIVLPEPSRKKLARTGRRSSAAKS